MRKITYWQCNLALLGVTIREYHTCRFSAFQNAPWFQGHHKTLWKEGCSVRCSLVSNFQLDCGLLGMGYCKQNEKRFPIFRFPKAPMFQVKHKTLG